MLINRGTISVSSFDNTQSMVPQGAGMILSLCNIKLTASLTISSIALFLEKSVLGTINQATETNHWLIYPINFERIHARPRTR